MPRNQTIMHQHPAEFRGTPFARPTWTVRHWQTTSTEPYAVSTMARDLLADGWRELSDVDMLNAFGTDRTTDGMPIHRAFVKSEGSSRFGHIVTLTDKKGIRS